MTQKTSSDSASPSAGAGRQKAERSRRPRPPGCELSSAGAWAARACAEHRVTTAAAKKKRRPLPIQRKETALAPELTAKTARLATAPGTSGPREFLSARQADHTSAAQKATKSASPTAPNSAKICRYSLCAPALRNFSLRPGSFESGWLAAKAVRASGRRVLKFPAPTPASG